MIDVEGEDFAGAGGGVIEQPPQCFVPRRMLGGQEGQQLGLGDGTGAGVVVAVSTQAVSFQCCRR